MPVAATRTDPGKFSALHSFPCALVDSEVFLIYSQVATCSENNLAGAISSNTLSLTRTLTAHKYTLSGFRAQ